MNKSLLNEERRLSVESVFEMVAQAAEEAQQDLQLELCCPCVEFYKRNRHEPE